MNCYAIVAARQRIQYLRQLLAEGCQLNYSRFPACQACLHILEQAEIHNRHAAGFRFLRIPFHSKIPSNPLELSRFLQFPFLLCQIDFPLVPMQGGAAGIVGKAGKEVVDVGLGRVERLRVGRLRRDPGVERVGTQGL